MTEPCRLEIVATSNQFDFPTPKPVGGFSAGAFMMGSFAGPQAVSPNGDTISATSEASGIRLVTDDSGGGHPGDYYRRCQFDARRRARQRRHLAAVGLHRHAWLQVRRKRAAQGVLDPDQRDGPAAM